jgi:UMF1 family MFS transporter
MTASSPAQNARPLTRQDFPVNDRREIFGWMMYDWANSGFYTTVATALLGPYLTVLAQTAVGENGVILSFGALGAVTAKSFFPFCVAASVFLQVFLLPTLGAIADYTNLKKRLMIFFCYVGTGATCLLFFITVNLYLLGGLLYIIANLTFGATIVIYNAFLPEITTEEMRDKVSSRGFAIGYLGGGLLLAANLALVSGAARLGISQALAVRLSILSAGLWWGGFSLITFTRLHVRRPMKALPADKNYLTVGFSQLRETFRELRRLPHTLQYLIAYLFYNDGIQTVISMSTVFLSQELFRARGLEIDQSFLLGLLLVIQFVAFFGSLIFERVANRFGTKNAIMISLILWSGAVIYTYGFLYTIPQAWLMGVLIALVLGGSQALSRSLFSLMIPKGREAAFFGIYEISERGTSWMGPLIFGIVVAATNSYRQAVLSLIIFFIVGMLILFFTNTMKAVHSAGNALPEEAESISSSSASV